MVGVTDTAAGGSVRDGKAIGLVGAAHLVSHVYMLVLPPLFAFIKADYGVSYAELGGVLAAFNIVSAALQAPTGFLVDRLGARAILVAGLLLGASAMALAALLPSYAALVLAFALAGLANTVYHPADYSILSHVVSAKRMGQAFSIHTFFGLLGAAIAPAGMLLLARLWGWRGALLGAAALGYAVALLLVVARDALEGGRPPTGGALLSRRGGDSGWRLLLSPPILMNVLFFLLINLANGGLSNFSVVALTSLYGTPLAVANVALSAFLLLSALGVLIGGFIADRTSRHIRVAVIGFGAGAIIVLVIGTIDLGSWPLVLMMSLGGLFNGMIMPSRDMIVRAVTPPGSFGKVFGFVSAGFNVGGVIGPLVFGWLMDRGSPRGIFLLVAGVTLLSLLTVLNKPQRIAAE